MADRRMGDRREQEKGVIRIEFKDAIIYLIITIVLIISISSNIVLVLRNKQYKKEIERYKNNEEALYEDDIYYEDEYIDDEYLY